MDRQSLEEVLNLPGLAVQLSLVDKEMLKIIGQNELSTEAEKLIKAGGKRLRPSLVVATAQLGLSKNGVVRAAAAVELLHLASLVHDDVIDGDTIRRGTAASTVAAKSILLGDFLIAKGIAALIGINREAAIVLSAAITAMAAGMSSELTDKHKPFSKSYLGVIEKKTAALIAAACQIGAICGGLPDREIEILAIYGACFGASFQIIDDLQDSDIPKSATQKALELIGQNNLAATRRARQLGTHKIAEGLARLPGYYLEWSLKNLS